MAPTQEKKAATNSPLTIKSDDPKLRSAKSATAAAKRRSATKKGGTAAKKATTPRKQTRQQVADDLEKRQNEAAAAAAKKEAQKKAQPKPEVDELVRTGIALGLDVEPERYDEDALKGAIQQVAGALRKAGMKDSEIAMALTQDDPFLTHDQGDRALAHPAGLTGKALMTYILDGKTSGEQVKEAREERAAAATEQRKERAKALGQTGPRPGSGMAAAITVLTKARNPLTPDEIWERIKKDNLAPGMKGKTPAATIGAQLATALKAGKIEGLERPTPGHYTIKKAGGR